MHDIQKHHGGPWDPGGMGRAFTAGGSHEACAPELEGRRKRLVLAPASRSDLADSRPLPVPALPENLRQPLEVIRVPQSRLVPVRTIELF